MPKKKTEEDLLVEFIGETISPESAILACSINLMRAGDIAKQMQDTESLLKVSKAWYELARYLGGDLREEERSNPIGFTTLEVDIDEPGDGPDESEGGIEVRSKSRKL